MIWKAFTFGIPFTSMVLEIQPLLIKRKCIYLPLWQSKIAVNLLCSFFSGMSPFLVTWQRWQECYSSMKRKQANLFCEFVLTFNIAEKQKFTRENLP